MRTGEALHIWLLVTSNRTAIRAGFSNAFFCLLRFSRHCFELHYNSFRWVCDLSQNVSKRFWNSGQYHLALNLRCYTLVSIKLCV
jgi:hypothetical protein